MSIVLTCREFFDGMDLHGATRLTLTDGMVTSVERWDGACEYALLSPGLVDIQMNGFGRYDVSQLDGSTGPQLDDLLATLGTTSWLGTIVTAPLGNLATSLERVDALMRDGAVPGCAGTHLEGPFLGGAPGAHNPAWIGAIDSEWVSSLPPSLRVLTVAAEQDGFESLSRALRNRDVTLSIGHSRPSQAQFTKAVEAGATLVTHLFNGMSGVHHRDGGLALWALTDDRVRVGLIADLVHTNPESVSLAFRSKPHDGVCLVSDSVAWETERSTRNGVHLVGGAPRLPDGTIAGSSTPLAECVRNAVTVCRVDRVSALRAATSTPARAVGLDDHGRIETGHPADVVAFDADLHVVRTWRRLPFGRAQQTDS